MKLTNWFVGCAVAALLGVVCSCDSTSSTEALDAGTTDLTAVQDTAAEEDTQHGEDASDASAPQDATPSDVEVAWPWPTCESRPPGSMPLVEKAAYLDELMRAQHLPDGLVRTLRFDPDGELVGYDHQPSTGLWTGIYMASQALRYAVTGDTEAVENALVAARGLHDLTAVTGRPGLYGRAYQRPDGQYTYDATGQTWWFASPAEGYEGWWYNGDVSKDTMDGIVFGYAMALEHFDDAELLAIVRSDLLAFVNQFVADGLQILDHEGVVTEHGRLNYSALDDWPGFNAMLVLSWVRSALDAGGDPELRHFYEDCLLRRGDRSDCPELDSRDFGSYLDAVEDWLYVYRPNCETSFDNIDMVFQGLYPLLRREDHPETVQRLRAVLDVGIWTPPEPPVAPPLYESTHSLYIFMYGGLANPDPGDTIFQAAMDDAICTMFDLPAERWDHGVPETDREGICINRVGKPNAAEVLPLSEREWDNYLWRLDPYEISPPKEPVPGLLYSAEDYLLAYWLGRYHGLIPADL